MSCIISVKYDHCIDDMARKFEVRYAATIGTIIPSQGSSQPDNLKAIPRTLPELSWDTYYISNGSGRRCTSRSHIQSGATAPSSEAIPHVTRDH